MKIKLGILFLICLFLVACASMTSSKPASKKVQFESIPPGAEIYVNGELKGKTPKSIRIESEKEYVLEFKLEGYKTKTVTINQSWHEAYSGTGAASSVDQTGGSRRYSSYAVPDAILVYRVELEEDK